MAAGSLTLLPVTAFALLVHRHVLRGMTLGAVKGSWIVTTDLRGNAWMRGGQLVRF